MKQAFFVIALLLLVACSPATPNAGAATESPVSDVELAEVDDILGELDDLDAELNLDAELAALDADLQ